MSRYIDADDAIERLGAYLMADAQIEWGGTASENIEDWKELATDILKGSPSIDICFCKECRYCKRSVAHSRASQSYSTVVPRITEMLKPMTAVLGESLKKN